MHICYQNFSAIKIILLSKFIYYQHSSALHRISKLFCYQISSTLKVHLHPKFICNLSSSTLKVIFNQTSSVIENPVLSKFAHTQVTCYQTSFYYHSLSTLIIHLPSQFIYYQTSSASIVYLLLLFIIYQRSLIIKCHLPSTFICNQSQYNQQSSKTFTQYIVQNSTYVQAKS